MVVEPLAVALLLGLRHATDPDHLAAVSTLVLSDRDEGGRGALRLGLAWGAGHAATLVLLGLPVVLYGDALPHAAQQAAEVAVGALIVALAIRLLLFWRRRMARSPRAAFGIGLVHGVGGSAGVSVLAISTGAALVLFAAATAASMALASAAFGRALATAPAQRRAALLAPALGAAALLFGAWYLAAAL